MFDDIDDLTASMAVSCDRKVFAMQTTSILTHPASRAQAVINAAEMYLSAPERLLFSSNDLDEVRSMVGRVMKPHRLQLASDTERLNARMHYIILGNTSISRLRYGATVQIDAGALKDFFLVQIPLCGTAVIESGGQRIESCQELASVLSPDHETRMIWRSGNDQILLKVSRALLERTLIGHLGRPLDTPLRFQLGFQWRDSASWCGMLSYLLDCAVQYPNLDQHKIVLNQIEQLCASILLTSHEHNYSCSQPVRRNTILPRHVRRAQDYMQAHAHEPMSVDQLAQIAGVSVRGPLHRIPGVPERQSNELLARSSHGTCSDRVDGRGRQQRSQRRIALGIRSYGTLR